MTTGTATPNLKSLKPPQNPDQSPPDPPAHPVPHPLPQRPLTMILLPESLLNWLLLSRPLCQTAFKLTKSRLFMDTWGNMMEKKWKMYRPYWLLILQMALHFDSIIRSIYNATTPAHLSKIKFRIKIWFTLFESCKSFQNHTSCICITLWIFLKYLLLAFLMFFWIYLFSKVFFLEIHGDN